MGKGGGGWAKQRGPRAPRHWELPQAPALLPHGARGRARRRPAPRLRRRAPRLLPQRQQPRPRRGGPAAAAAAALAQRRQHAVPQHRCLKRASRAALAKHALPLVHVLCPRARQQQLFPGAEGGVSDRKPMGRARRAAAHALHAAAAAQRDGALWLRVKGPASSIGGALFIVQQKRAPCHKKAPLPALRGGA